VNGTKSIAFSLYDSAAGGTPIYSQTQQVNIVNGAFSVYLGKGDKGEGNYQGAKVSDGIPAAVFTEHSARYLGVKIEGSSSEMTPRQLMASVAYACKAERAREAENLMGQVTVDASSGKVGIGTANPSGQLDVGGGKLVVKESGNVGIGEISPEAKLHVNGSVYIEQAPFGEGNKNPIRGADFATATLPGYSGKPGGSGNYDGPWTNTGQSISLPAAGIYWVIYNAQGFRQQGSRGEQSLVQLSTTTGGKSGIRHLSGVYNDTTQSSGSVTIIHVFTVSAPDTVNVQAADGFGGEMSLSTATLTYIRIG
jgi:hypothetical protein